MCKYLNALLASVLFLGILDLGRAELTPPISISSSREFRPRSPSEIKSVEDAMAAIITITSKDLGFPLIDPLYIHLHPDTKSFAAQAGSSGRRLSESVVQFAVATAQENRFHVNMERVKNRPWSALMWTLAHEYAHNVEYAFSSLHRSSQWLREGFADWVAARVLHTLRWQDYEVSVHRARLEVWRQRASLPTLSDLEDGRGWSVWANNPNGYILTYRLAFLAIDDLMSKASVPQIARYFATQDFENNFGISWRQFEREFKAKVNEITTPTNAFGKSEKPEWKIGYQWQYSWKVPGRQGTLVREVAREEVLDGRSVYVLKVGDNEVYYTKESLGLLANAQKGKIISRRKAPLEYFSWPLEIHKEWKSTYVSENLAQKASQKLAFQIVVAAAGKISVSAGVFDAVKIEIYGDSNGQLVSEHWYAPGARWFVKNRTYPAEGVREEELLSYKID